MVNLRNSRPIPNKSVYEFVVSEIKNANLYDLDKIPEFCENYSNWIQSTKLNNLIGLDNFNFNSPKEGSIALFKDQTWRNFFLNEPRGGVFKHCNIIVKPSDPKADAGFIIMEPEDNPPMSGSNSICVTTVLLEKNILRMELPITTLQLEAPGGLVKIIAECEKNKVKNVSVTNLPSFVDQVDVELITKNYGKIIVSTAYGGDSFLLCEAKDFNLKTLVLL